MIHLFNTTVSLFYFIFIHCLFQYNSNRASSNKGSSHKLGLISAAHLPSKGEHGMALYVRQAILLPSLDFVNKIFDSSLLPSLWVVILFNSTALGIHLCMIFQLNNFKTRLGDEVKFA